MKPLPKKYDHKETEKRWQNAWEQAQVYAWDENESRENTYVIDTPPPTVSGLLHMGHVFSYTQADFVARYQRMAGKTVFYPMGFDDNGLPTERLVEKVKKVRATDMSREDFIELCEGVAEEARAEFRKLFEEIALSVDWQQEYHTISADSRKISQLSFLDLYNKDRAYRKLQPMLWDPVDQTAIAQAEIEDKEMPSQKNYLHFGLVEENSLSSLRADEISSLSRLRGRVREGATASITWQNSKKLIENAKNLRQNSTDVEKIIWSLLRRKQLKGYKFRRQHPLEKYVLDFVCNEAKLVIELDGGQHADNKSYDNKRTEFIEKRGYKVLRFWNNEVTENLEGVLETIWNALPDVEAVSPLPNPPPQAGEGTLSAPAQAEEITIRNSLQISEEVSDKLEIMTTRPELLGACVAVMCHPDDAHLYEGKMAVTPVFGVIVPIIPDDKVDKEKGTGLVMCCTFGDETDIAWWREHELKTRVLLNKYGKVHVAINDDSISYQYGDDPLDASNTVDIKKTIAAFEEVQNKKVRTTAREKMLELLDAEGAIFKDPEVTVHAEPCAERSGSPLEILPTNQWFVKILDQKEQLKDKAAECNWYPEFMKIRMDQWIDGLSWDWCISRQRYFGVPFPVWYVQSIESGAQDIVIARPEDLPANPLASLPHGYEKIQDLDGLGWLAKGPDGKQYEVIPEADVMDTWATSSVSPQLSSKGITNELAVDAERHSKLFPADLRPQAHEIIRTWAFYTVVKAHLHEETIPWQNLMISGWCLASDKTKMSKSKGNVVTPVDLIEEKGSDVVRFWASTSRLGADTAYSEDVLKIGKKLVTKLWNATKFAAIHLDKLEQKPGTAIADVEAGIINEPLDLWVLTKLNKAITKATQEFDRYEYCNARGAAEDFFWNDLCDNYLELVKVRVYGEAEGVTKQGQMSAVHTIYHCLDGILRLFAPIVPHITEELYSHIFDDKIKEIGGSIHARGTWLKAADYPLDENAEKSGQACVSVLDAIRKMKAERNVSIKWPLNFVAITSDGAEEQIGVLAEDLKNVTSASELVFADKTPKEGQGQTVEADNGYTVIAEFAEENSNAA